MRLLSTAIAPEFDHGFGVICWLMRFHARFQGRPVGPAEVVGGPSEQGGQTQAMNTNNSQDEMRAIWFSGRPFRSGSGLLREVPSAVGADSVVKIEEHRGPLAIADGLGVKALDGEGFGISFAGPTRRLVTTRPEDRARWDPLSTHLAAGLRLRRRLGGARELEPGAEAIFTPDG